MTKTTHQKQTELLRLAQLKFQSDQVGMAALIKRETTLRQRLLAINDSEKIGRRTASTDAVLQRANAILPWQNWVAHHRDQMNIELAQIMAQKEFARATLQQSFGQREATKSLLRQSVKAQQKSLARQRARSS
ncbi:MAG: hypothetical protein ACRBBQ_00855 [Cognatishimia sp.]